MAADVERVALGAPGVGGEEFEQGLSRRPRRQGPQARGRAIAGRFRLVPRAEAPLKGPVIVAAANAVRQRVEQPDVTAAHDDVLGRDGGTQQFGALKDERPPLLDAERRQPALSQQGFEGLVLERQVGQFQRHDGACVHERGAESRAEAEEQHAAPVVAAEGLHGGVVHDLDRHAEGRIPVELNPSRAEVPGFLNDLAANDGAGNADRDGVEGPAGRVGLDAGDHLRRREAITRVKLAHLRASGVHQFDVGAAHVDDQDTHARGIENNE